MKMRLESLDDPHIAKNYIENFQLVIPLDYFIENGEKIVSDFGYYGSIVLIDKSDNLYGLFFKDKGIGSNGAMYMKCHVYRWPQSGVIHGGVSFFSDAENIGVETKAAVQQVR